MPTVPYSPVPSASPSEAGIGSVHIQAPTDAFGGAVGQALSHLGQTVGKVGDEMWQRAVALQHLQNETEAKEADAKYMMEVGRLHADYSSLQGKQAVEAYPKYMQNIQDLRRSFRDNLSNDEARKMYDGSSLSVMSRTIFNGAGHAATENKRWAMQSSNARVELWGDQALSSPKDDVAFQRSIRGAEEEVRSQGNLAGWGEDQVNNNISKTTSHLWSQRIVGLARTNPNGAQAMLEANRDKIRGQDIDRVEKAVAGQLHSVGSRNISDAVNAGWAPYMPQKDIEKSIGIEEPLVRVFKEAQRANPDLRFTIGDGPGGDRERNGRSINAVPLNPADVDNGRMLEEIDGAMVLAAKKLGIPLEADKENHGLFRLPKDYNVATAPKKVEESLESRIARAEAEAKATAPDDPVYADYVRQRVIADFNQKKTIKKDAEYENRNVVAGAISEGINGKLPTTQEELIADPKVAAAWDSLDDLHKATFRKALAANARGDTAWNADSLKRYQELKGMANSDPAEFLGINVAGERFPNRTKLELINLQERLRKQAGGDPQVNRAIQWLRPDMTAAGLERVVGKKEDYDRFVGLVSDAIAEYQAEHKKAPPREEIQKIGARLLQQISVPGWLWGTNKTPLYEIPVPDDAAEIIRSDPRWGDIVPTDEMIRRVYITKRYQQLYGKKKETTP